MRRSLDDVVKAYLEQLHAIQKLGGRIILMASRALVRVAKIAGRLCEGLFACAGEADHPVILHWLGDMFDPALKGYWGSADFPTAMETCLAAISGNVAKVDGIKISLLDDGRRKSSCGAGCRHQVKMYTGDDFNYPALIAGDDKGFSHALLGIFDAIAPAAAAACRHWPRATRRNYDKLLDPTVPLSRLIFRAPTQFYKTGIVFLAWLNGHQDHFVMVNGAQSACGPCPISPRPSSWRTRRDCCAIPALAVKRMKIAACRLWA